MLTVTDYALSISQLLSSVVCVNVVEKVPQLEFLFQCLLLQSLMLQLFTSCKVSSSISFAFDISLGFLHPHVETINCLGFRLLNDTTRHVLNNVHEVHFVQSW